MARPCTVCQHPEREDVDRAIVADTPHAQVADRFGLSRQAVTRHRENHLSPALQRVHEEREVARAKDLLGRLEGMVDRLERFTQEAEASGKGSQFLGGMRELRATVELLGKATGELDSGGTTVNVVNLTQSAEWLEVQATMLRALAPYPEARQAVARALALPRQPEVLEITPSTQGGQTQGGQAGGSS